MDSPTGKPFFAYVALTQPHLPSEPNPAFKGKTGHGHWADMLAEMEANVGQMLDAVDTAGVPTDRPLKSLDQSDFFLGKTEKSARESFPI